MQTLRMTAAAAALLCCAAASAGTLTIESWRVDDKALWEDVLVPAFNKHHPDIKIRFTPTNPPEYLSTLNARLAGGTAGDLITCKPFDQSLDVFRKGHLESLNGLPALEQFPASAKVAWQTDDGKTTYCVPMASVIHGFFYNTAIFKELGLTVPKTEAEFFAMLDKVKASKKYAPIAQGTADQWETTQIVYTSIGPNYWQGEAGRKGLIDGKAKFTDPGFVKTWDVMSKWAPYLPKGYQAQTYGDSQNLFGGGKAAIYPAGSWDISFFHQNSKVAFGAFKPPVAKEGDPCFISDHTDIGMGINSKSPNKAEAKVFLEWLSSAEFADLYTNKVTGFFSLSKHEVQVKDPVAAEMMGWRKECKSTIRLNAQILSRGTPSMENELWNVGAQVMNGKMKPADAAAKIQTGLDSWYKPAGK